MRDISLGRFADLDERGRLAQNILAVYYELDPAWNGSTPWKCSAHRRPRGLVRVSASARPLAALAPPRVEEVSAGIYAYIQPDGTWWLNNTGFLVGASRVAAVDACSTEARTRALLAAIAATAGGRCGRWSTPTITATTPTATTCSATRRSSRTSEAGQDPGRGPARYQQTGQQRHLDGRRMRRHPDGAALPHLHQPSQPVRRRAEVRGHPRRHPGPLNQRQHRLDPGTASPVRRRPAVQRRHGVPAVRIGHRGASGGGGPEGPRRGNDRARTRPGLRAGDHRRRAGVPELRR